MEVWSGLTLSSTFSCLDHDLVSYFHREGAVPQSQVALPAVVVGVEELLIEGLLLVVRWGLLSHGLLFLE